MEPIAYIEMFGPALIVALVFFAGIRRLVLWWRKQ